MYFMVLSPDDTARQRAATPVSTGMRRNRHGGTKIRKITVCKPESLYFVATIGECEMSSHGAIVEAG
jgi:hypothetical protein